MCPKAVAAAMVSKIRDLYDAIFFVKLPVDLLYFASALVYCSSYDNAS